eukprot:s1103_g24.t1
MRNASGTQQRALRIGQMFSRSLDCDLFAHPEFCLSHAMGLFNFQCPCGWVANLVVGKWQDVMNVLDLRWAWQYKPDWEVKKGRGGLSADDESLLRCMMRRYGQELLSAPTGPCEWSQCFDFQTEKKKKFIDFAWFLVQQLLHPRDASELAELRRRHDPVAVRKHRSSRMGARAGGYL